MKLSDRISCKKSLAILGLYAIVLAGAGYLVGDSLYPIRDLTFSTAVDRNKQELRENPGNSEAHARLGWIYYQIALEEKNPVYSRKAEKEYRKALELAPGNTGFRYSYGLILEEMGQTKLAQEQYEKIIQIEPNHELANYNLAILFSKAGKYEQAIRHYKKVLELEPTAGNVYYELGRIYEDIQDLKNAIDMYRQAIKYTPDNWDAKQRLQVLAGNGK